MRKSILALIITFSLLLLIQTDITEVQGESSFPIQDADPGDVVTVNGTHTISSDLTVPPEVILNLACDEERTTYFKDGSNPNGTSSNTKKLVTKLIIEKGVTVTVEGTLLVNAQTCWAAWNCNLNITGGYAMVENHGTIIIKDGGMLDNFGEIRGDGEIVAESGSTVRDRYSIVHWRGGDTAKMCYENGVYPMNEYNMSSITCPITIKSGASYVGAVKLYVGGAYRFATFPQIDNENGIIRLVDGAYVEKVRENGRSVYTIHGGADFRNSRMELGGMNMSTSDFTFPMDGDITLVLCDGQYNVMDDFKVLPGAVVEVVDSNITVCAGASLTMYDYFDDLTTWIYPEEYSTKYPERDPSYLRLDDSTLRIWGSFAGRVFTSNGSDVVVVEGASTSTATLEAYGTPGANKGDDGTHEILHYAVVIDGEPSRYIKWYHIDSSLEREWDGTMEEGMLLYSGQSDAPVDEERLFDATKGVIYSTESSDGSMMILYACAIVVALFIAIPTIRHHMKKNNRNRR